VQPPIVVLDEIEAFLRQADLVKFARLTPTEAECEIALERGERIVHQTIPYEPRSGAAPPPSPPPHDPATPRDSSFAPPAAGSP
jgi:hypothetical protein